MGVDPEEIIQSDKDSLVITRADGTKDIRYGNPLERLKEPDKLHKILFRPEEPDQYRQARSIQQDYCCI